MTVDSGRKTTTLWGVPLKHISLVTLTFQNSALILIMHYSRVMPLVDGKRYFTSTAVFLNEVMKLAISLTMALYEASGSSRPNISLPSLFSSLFSAVFTGDSWKLAIPAMLYTLQNSLQYVAVSNLDAATFQVTYQLKILTTALFSVTMLGRSLSIRKWVSLVLLMVGVGIVQLPSGATDPAKIKEVHARFALPRSMGDLAGMRSKAAADLVGRTASATYEGIQHDEAAQHPQMNASLGLIAVIIACMISGLAGVYFEKVLKDSSSNASLWVRNVQLSFYSLFPAFFIGVVFKDGAEIAKSGFFTGYNGVVWTAIIFQALGGIVVALVVNYADNIAKNFATSISIVISFVASVYLFDLSITTTYLIGTAVVLYATYLYSSPDRRPSNDIEITRREDDQSYMDGARSPTLANTPLMSEEKSSSRPTTPATTRHHTWSNSEWRQYAKREA